MSAIAVHEVAARCGAAPSERQDCLQRQQQEKFVPEDTATQQRSQQAGILDGSKAITAAASPLLAVAAVAAGDSGDHHAGNDERPIHPKATVSYATSPSDVRICYLRPPSPAYKAAMSVLLSPEQPFSSDVAFAVDQLCLAAGNLISTAASASASSSTTATAALPPRGGIPSPRIARVSPTRTLLYMPWRSSSPGPGTRETMVTGTASPLGNAAAAFTVHLPVADRCVRPDHPRPPNRVISSPAVDRSRAQGGNGFVGAEDDTGFDGPPVEIATVALVSEEVPVSPTGDLAEGVDEDMADVIRAIRRVFVMQKADTTTTTTRTTTTRTTRTTRTMMTRTTVAGGDDGSMVGGDVRDARNYRPTRNEAFTVTADLGHASAPPSLTPVPATFEPDWERFACVFGALRALGVPTAGDSTDGNEDGEEEAKGGQQDEDENNDQEEEEEDGREEDKNAGFGSLAVPMSPKIFQRDDDAGREQRVVNLEMCHFLCFGAPLASPTMAEIQYLRESAPAVPARRGGRSSVAKASVTVEADAEGSARRTASAREAPVPLLAADPSVASLSLADTAAAKISSVVALERTAHAGSASSSSSAEESATPETEGEYTAEAGTGTAGVLSQESVSMFTSRRPGVEEDAVLRAAGKDSPHVAPMTAEKPPSAGPVTSVWVTHGSPVVSGLASIPDDAQGEGPALTQGSASREGPQTVASGFGVLLQTFFFGSSSTGRPRTTASVSAGDRPVSLVAPAEGGGVEQAGTFAEKEPDIVSNTGKGSYRDDRLSSPTGSEDGAAAPLNLGNPHSTVTSEGPVVEEVDQAGAAVEELVLHYVYEDDDCSLYELPTPVGSVHGELIPASPETETERQVPVLATRETPDTKDDDQYRGESDGVSLDVQQASSCLTPTTPASAAVDGSYPSGVAALVTAAMITVVSKGAPDTIGVISDSTGAAAAGSYKHETVPTATAGDGEAEDTAVIAGDRRERQEASEVPTVPDTDVGTHVAESSEDEAAAAPMLSGSGVTTVAEAPVEDEVEHVAAAAKSAAIVHVVEDIDVCLYEERTVGSADDLLSPASVETEAEKSVLVAGAEEISENKDVGESEGQLLDPARGLWPEELCLWPFPMTVEDSMMDLTVDDDSADSLGSIPSAEEASDAADSPVMNNNLLFFETWESGPREAWLYTIDENMVLMGEGDAVEETESAHGSFGNDEELGAATTGSSTVASSPETGGEQPASADAEQGSEGGDSSHAETIPHDRVAPAEPETTAPTGQSFASASFATSVAERARAYDFLTLRAPDHHLVAEAAGDASEDDAAEKAAAEEASADGPPGVDGGGQQVCTRVEEALIEAGTEDVNGRSISEVVDIPGVTTHGAKHFLEKELDDGETVVAQRSAADSAHEATPLARTWASDADELIVSPDGIRDAEAMDGASLVEAGQRASSPSAVDGFLCMPLLVSFSSPVYGFGSSVTSSDEMSDGGSAQDVETDPKEKDEPVDETLVVAVPAERGNSPLFHGEGVVSSTAGEGEDEGLLQPPLADVVVGARGVLEHAPAGAEPSAADLAADAAIEVAAVEAEIEDVAAVMTVGVLSDTPSTPYSMASAEAAEEAVVASTTEGQRNSTIPSSAGGDGVAQIEEAGGDEARGSENDAGSAKAQPVFAEEHVSGTKDFPSAESDVKFDGSPAPDLRGFVAQMVSDSSQAVSNALQIVGDKLTPEDGDASLPETEVEVGGAEQPPGTVVGETREPEVTRPPATDVTVVGIVLSLEVTAGVTSSVPERSSAMVSEVFEAEGLERATEAVDDAPGEAAMLFAGVKVTSLSHTGGEEDVARPQDADSLARACGTEPSQDIADGSVKDVAGQTAAEETADEGHCEHAPADCERRLVAISQNPVAAEDEATRASASGKAEESTQTSETGMSVTELDNPSSEMSPVASGEDALESTTAVESVRLPRVLGTDLLALLKSDFLAGLHEELSPQVLSLICPAVPEELLPAASSQRPEVDNTSVADEAGPVDKHALLEHAAAEETAPRVQELVTNHTSQLPSKAETDGVTKLVEPAPADGLPSKGFEDGLTPATTGQAGGILGVGPLPATNVDRVEVMAPRPASDAVDDASFSGMEAAGAVPPFVHSAEKVSPGTLDTKTEPSVAEARGVDVGVPGTATATGSAAVLADGLENSPRSAWTTKAQSLHAAELLLSETDEPIPVPFVEVFEVGGAAVDPEVAAVDIRGRSEDASPALPKHDLEVVTSKTPSAAVGDVTVLVEWDAVVDEVGNENSSINSAAFLAANVSGGGQPPSSIGLGEVERSAEGAAAGYAEGKSPVETEADDANDPTASPSGERVLSDANTAERQEPIAVPPGGVGTGMVGACSVVGPMIVQDVGLNGSYLSVDTEGEDVHSDPR